MQGLADELGVSRVTLFRRVGGREELISQALWRLTERMLELRRRPLGGRTSRRRAAHPRHHPAHQRDGRRVVGPAPAAGRRARPDLARDHRPRGRVQSGTVAFIEELLRRDMAEFGLVTVTEPSALAYALVRLGESLLYVDVLAARKPDAATAGCSRPSSRGAGRADREPASCTRDAGRNMPSAQRRADVR